MEKTLNYIHVFQLFFIIFNNLQCGYLQTVAPVNCPTDWLNVGTAPQCQCLKLMPTLPAGTTFMSSPRLCLNLDARSNLIAFDGDAQRQQLNSFAEPNAATFSLANVPVGLYLDNAGNIRHLEDQAVTPPLSNVIGKCQYLLASGSFLTNNSCLQQPQSGICVMDCGNPPMPPAPTITIGTNRCNAPDFNMTCTAGWINLGGLCYKNPVDSNTLSSKLDAASACAAAGGWLPSFSNLNEWQAVMNYAYYIGISGADSWAAPMWLGGTLADTTSTWDDGTPTTFSYWAPYQPLGQSPCMWWSVGQGDYWSEGDCTTPGVAFCQYYSCSTTTMTSTTSTTASSMSTTTTNSPTHLTSTTTATSSPKLSSTTAPPTSSEVSTTTSRHVTITTTLANVTSTLLPTTKVVAASQSPVTTSTLTTMTTGTITGSQIISTSDGSCVNRTFDFSQKCTQIANSFYDNGICYSLFAQAVQIAYAETACRTAYNGNLAVIRSVEVFKNLKKINDLLIDPQSENAWWIQIPNNNPWIYYQLDNTMTSDGKNMLSIQSVSTFCLAAMWYPSAPNLYVINSAFPCWHQWWPVCETRSMFEQKGCEQVLNRGPCVVASVTTSPNTNECAQACAAQNWCAGFNYNPTSQMCEILTANTQMQNLVCESGWVYYERV